MHAQHGNAKPYLLCLEPKHSKGYENRHSNTALDTDTNTGNLLRIAPFMETIPKFPLSNGIFRVWCDDRRIPVLAMRLQIRMRSIYIGESTSLRYRVCSPCVPLRL
jgi:hypothetical protein